MVSGQGNGNLPKLFCGIINVGFILGGPSLSVKCITFLRSGSFAVFVSSEAGSNGQT